MEVLKITPELSAHRTGWMVMPGECRTLCMADERRQPESHVQYGSGKFAIQWSRGNTT